MATSSTPLITNYIDKSVADRGMTFRVVIPFGTDPLLVQEVGSILQEFMDKNEAQEETSEDRPPGRPLLEWINMVNTNTDETNTVNPDESNMVDPDETTTQSNAGGIYNEIYALTSEVDQLSNVCKRLDSTLSAALPPGFRLDHEGSNETAPAYDKSRSPLAQELIQQRARLMLLNANLLALMNALEL